MLHDVHGSIQLVGFFKGLIMFMMALLEFVGGLLGLLVGFAIGLACLILPVYFFLKFIGYAVGKGMESAKGK